MNIEQAKATVEAIASANPKFKPVTEPIYEHGYWMVQFKPFVISQPTLQSWFLAAGGMLTGYGHRMADGTMQATWKTIEGAMTTQILVLMDKEEAQRTVGKINACAGEMGRLLLDLKQREGWRALEYNTWTECLENEFVYSRNRLYEFMRSAPVMERLQSVGYSINTDQALALNKLPESIQQPVYEMAYKRSGGKPTANQIEAIGDTLAEAVNTGGYVTTADGEQNAVESSINNNRREQEIAKRESQQLINCDAKIARRYEQDDGDYLVLCLPRGLSDHVNHAHYIHIVITEAA